jgi:hypothetical protein
MTGTRPRQERRTLTYKTVGACAIHADLHRPVGAGTLPLVFWIQDELYISETTAKTHVTHILQKLGLRDRVQAVVLAYQTGVFEGERGSATPS